MAPRRRRPPATQGLAQRGATQATRRARGQRASPSPAPSAATAASGDGGAGPSRPAATARRRAPRRDGLAGQDTDDADLVPPSDDDEYDAWLAAREAAAAREASGMSSPGAGPSQPRAHSVARSETASVASSATASTARLSFIQLLDDEDDPGSVPLSDDTAASLAGKGKGRASVRRAGSTGRRAETRPRSRTREPSATGSPSRNLAPASTALSMLDADPAHSPRRPAELVDAMSDDDLALHGGAGGAYSPPRRSSAAPRSRSPSMSPDPLASPIRHESLVSTSPHRPSPRKSPDVIAAPGLDGSPFSPPAATADRPPDSNSHDAQSPAPHRARPEPPLASPSPAPPSSAPPAPAEAVPPPPEPADPAFERFRSARTFRTRTALQLQPYTREKQAYERALRRGGLVVGARAVAAPTEVPDAGAPGAGASAPAGADDAAYEDGAATLPPDPVLGATPREPRRRPVEITDDDYDTFFFNAGRAAREDEDEDDARELRHIARARRRAEKDERRRARAAEKADRAFAQFVREKERGEVASTDDDAGGERARVAAARGERPLKKAALRTPANKTYSKKQRRREADQGGEDDTGTARRSARATRTPSVNAESPISRRPARRDPDSSPGVENGATGYELPPYDAQDDHDFDAPDAFELAFLGSGPAHNMDVDASHADPIALSSDDDTPTRAPRRAPPSPASSASSDSSVSSDGSQAIEDKRARIARRMLPAAMLKRLEREAADKQRRKLSEAERRRRAAKLDSPARPGRAVVRRGGGGAADLDADLFSDSADAQGDESDVSAGLATTSMRASSARPPSARFDSSADNPIVVLSDESSEAEEDNRGLESLARLHRGDFESIVAGRARARPPRPAAAPRRRVHRPALGLVPRITRAAPPLSPKNLVQTRLDFAPERPNAKPDRARPAAKRKRAPGGPRPAIRLDDHVIFAPDDFAFESEPEVERDAEPADARRKRVFGRTTSRPDAPGAARRASPAAARDRASGAGPTAARALDDGVGKARSWANFERFPIDFDISPLPSGIYCAPSTVPGSSRLRGLLDALRDGTAGAPAPVEAYDIVLLPDMSKDALDPVLPIVFDRLRAAVVAYANGRGGKPDLEPLGFLGDYAMAAGGLDVRSHLEQLTSALAQIVVSGSKRDRAVADHLLAVRWAVLELALKAAGPSDHEWVAGLGSALVGALLRYGFDRTMRPIKRVLRGDAETPEIDDVSVSLWVAAAHALAAHDARWERTIDTFHACLDAALDDVYGTDQVGPLAAERVWYLAFGLCALAQFGPDGVVGADFTPSPRWPLVERAIRLIKVAHSQEAEENAHRDQLRGRDRYIKAMVARCVRLSASWRWHFDRASFSVATRGLGQIFKARQHRNLPTEPPADFPRFITSFDISLTAAEDGARRESAFELYLRLACVAASDLIGAAHTLAEAQRAERDVRRLILAIFPLSAVAFSRALPPTPRQLGALVNRFSTMAVAAYFSPDLLPWLLANSGTWLALADADVESRQVAVRGYMYLAVACRHHAVPVEPVVRRLADVLAALAAELDAAGRPGNPPHFPARTEIERTMVLVVACFRQIILHHSYDVERQREPVYPDPTLLHESWTARVFALDLAKDTKSGLEIVATIQAFLDARARALPRKARRAREARITESATDDYPSLGFEFDDVDLAALGDGGAAEDPMERQDAAFAKIIMDVISPKIYRLLSDMLPAVVDDGEALGAEAWAERQAFIGKLTTCWSDCAAVVVVEHRLMDWSSFIGPFGTQSWSRLPSEAGRTQVGLHFMLTVARLDPSAFALYDDDFVALFFQAVAAARLTIEHRFAAALFAMPGALDHALFDGVRDALPPAFAHGPRTAPGGAAHPLAHPPGLDRDAFLAARPAVLRAVYANMRAALADSRTPAGRKTLVYRAANLLAAALAANLAALRPAHATAAAPAAPAALPAAGELRRAAYRAFARGTLADLAELAGDVISEQAVPSLAAARALLATD